MTRKSKRELERSVGDLAADTERPLGDILIAYEDLETGEWYDEPHPGGDLVGPDDVDPIAILPYRAPGDTQRSGEPEGGHLDA